MTEPVHLGDTMIITIATAVAGRLAELDAQAAEINAERDTLKARLRELLPTGRTQCGDIGVTITPTRRFDPATALTVLTPEEAQACTAIVIDSAKARQTLSADRYALCQKEMGVPAVRLK